MLLSALRRAFLLAQQTRENPEKSVEDVLSEWQCHANSRRQFLKTGAQAGALLGLGGAAAVGHLLEAPLLRPHYKVAIVGAGMAGLSAAWYLRKKGGIRAVVYEADKRPAGRMKSARIFDGGRLNTEIGAEFIDSTHKDMFRLIRDFGLKRQVMDVEDDKFGTKEAFFIENKSRSVRDIVEELNRVYPVMVKDQRKLGTPRAPEFDRISIEQYLDSLPISTWVKKLLNAAFLGENGRETGEQSAWNFLDFIEPLKDQFKPYGASDERYKIIGGNEQLPQRMAEKMRDQLRYEHRLTALKELNNGSLQLTFSQNGTPVEAIFDVVIVAIPFSVLRNIDLQMALPPIKKQMIEELGYGTNSKFIVETRARSWRKVGYQGYLFNEQVSNGWDSSQMQQNNEGVGAYTCYFGGQRGLSAKKGTETEQLSYVMPALDSIFPGMKADLTGKVELANWPSNPLTACSYSSFGVGQHTLFDGVGIQPVRHLFFAGEHCSDDFWGFMNGAAETGRKVASMVLKGA